MIYNSPHIKAKIIDDNIAQLTFAAEIPVNKLSQICLEDFSQAIDFVAASGASGLIIDSDKPAFIVGADIKEFLSLFSQEQAVLQDWIAKANAIFNKLEDLELPTISAINGFALGGGCETILACDFRIADTTAVIGLPETKLGIIPGFGGTVRLPRLIGADNAVEWITSGKHYKADAALKYGVVDAVVEPEQLHLQAKQMMKRAIQGELDWRARRKVKQSKLQLDAVELQMFAATARAGLAQLVHKSHVAPYKAVEVIIAAANCDRTGALQIELEGFLELTQTTQAKSLVQLFLNDQKVKSKSKKIIKESSEVTKAAVLGAGIMGGGIAYQSSLKGVPVVLKDIKAQALDVGIKQAVTLLNKIVTLKKITPEKMAVAANNITATTDYTALQNVDVVVEAVVENLEVKQQVLKETENYISAKAVLASNTSTIPISKLAASLKHPERFCGMHFFNPVYKMPLVEVIKGKDTSAATVATVCAYAQKMGKTPIVVQDCAGFFVNRVLFPYFNGFNDLLNDGVSFEQIDKTMQAFGWPMGPAYLLDVIGLDVACHAQKIMAAAYPERMTVTRQDNIGLLYDAKLLGQKNKTGFYNYELKKGKYIKTNNPDIVTKLPVVTNTDISSETIVARCMLPMLFECVRCLDEGVIGSAAEADIALIYGLGFPAFKGGAFSYLNNFGLHKIVELADSLASLGKIYQAPESLLKLASDNGSY